jgi:hypothetical protein
MAPYKQNGKADLHPINKDSGFSVQVSVPGFSGFKGSEFWVSGSRRELPYTPVFICHLTSDICLLLINL